MERVSKDNYYISIAKQVSMRGTCLRRNYGAIIVKNDEIISSGYTGSPRGCDNCSDIGFCLREKLNIKGKERYELCKSVHAEMNAIISASRKDMIGATLYLAGFDNNGNLHNANCCDMCKKMIINAGISDIKCCQEDGSIKVYHLYQFIDDIDRMNKK